MATKGFGVSELNVDGDAISAIESTGSLLIESNNGMTLRSVSGTIGIEGGTFAVVREESNPAVALTQLSDHNNWSITLNSNLTIPNPHTDYINPGQSGYIAIAQTAGGEKAVAWSSYWDFPDGVAPTLSSGANDVDIIGYYVRSSTSIVADAVTNIG